MYEGKSNELRELKSSMEELRHSQWYTSTKKENKDKLKKMMVELATKLQVTYRNINVSIDLISVLSLSVTTFNQ